MPSAEHRERTPPSPGDSFPDQHARTQRFSLGRPRAFTISPDGSRVAFLRSFTGDDPVTGLWVLELPEARERLVFDPREGGGDDADLPPEERARRERARERAEGVVSYSTDRAVTVAAFSVGGRLYLADLVKGGARRLPAVEPVFDPRLDPMGRRVGYVSGRTLHVTDVDGEDRMLVGGDDADVSWGLAEFVAAEEMDRREGFWWAPDGSRIAVARVDEREVRVWHIFDAVDPEATPRSIRYPVAGTRNADVRLFVLDLDGRRTEVEWDRERFEYLARVVWSEGRPLTLLVQSRDQRVTHTLAVGDGGETTLLREIRDEAWVELVPGSPAWTDDGRLVSTVDADDTRRLAVDGEPVTPAGLQVRRVVHVDGDVVFIASEDPIEEHVWRWRPDGAVERLTDARGVHDVVAEGEIAVITSATVDGPPTATVRRNGDTIATIASNQEEPVVSPAPTLFLAGARELRSALLVPGGHEPDAALPVLLDPYGGPGFQRVLRVRDEFLESQWFADQGFAVLVVDGRGSPARGPRWERAVHGDLAAPVLEDQLDALAAAAEHEPRLDLGRVALRGWSFGGYLAALAVLRRPDVVHAGIAGAPVTDWRLYDTHYTERYLGHPDTDPDAYRRSSLVDGDGRLLGAAPAPADGTDLLLIHGLADDNVVAAHTVRLSAALLADGRRHRFVPLSGVTHVAGQEDVAERLLELQVAFLKGALAR
jgi:dipeptidyl-peptidase 4